MDPNKLRLGALMVLGMAASACSADKHWARWPDFEDGKTVSGLPIDREGVAALKKPLTSFKSTGCSSWEPCLPGRPVLRPDGFGEVTTSLIRDDTPGSNGAILSWLFDGTSLVAVGWRAELVTREGDLHLVRKHLGIPLDCGETSRIQGSEAGSTKGDLILCERAGDPNATVYRVFDEPAFWRLAKARSERTALAAKKAHDDAAAKLAAELDAELAKMTRNGWTPVNLDPKLMAALVARTEKLEAEAPFTAAGMWFHLNYSQDGTLNRDYDASVAGLRRVLLPNCAKLMPLVVDWRNRDSLYITGHHLDRSVPIAFRFCTETGGENAQTRGYPLVAAVLAAGRPLASLKLGQRTVSEVKKVESGVTRSSETRVFTVKEKNPEYEKAVAPLRETERKIAELDAALASISTAPSPSPPPSDNGCVVFDGVESGTRGPSGQLQGGGRWLYHKAPCASSLFTQPTAGPVDPQAVALFDESQRLRRELDAAIEKLPPQLRPVTKTEVKTYKTPYTKWTATIHQSISIEGAASLAMDAPYEATLWAEAAAPITAGEATSRFMADDLTVGKSIADMVKIFLEKTAAAQGPTAPSINPKLTGDAAETERRWAAFFFANGPADGLWPAPPKVVGW